MKSIMLALVVMATLVSGCSSKRTVSADPLTGTWSGHWGPSPERQTEVVLNLKWDGTTLKGTVDPDRRGLELKKSTFNAQTNAIHMEIDTPVSGGGELDHYAIDGKVDGKSMRGTWTRRSGSGDFNITKE